MIGSWVADSYHLYDKLFVRIRIPLLFPIHKITIFTEDNCLEIRAAVKNTIVPAKQINWDSLPTCNLEKKEKDTQSPSSKEMV